MKSSRLILICESTNLDPQTVESIIYYYEKQKNLLNHIRDLIVPYEISQEVICKIVALYTAVESEEKTTYLTVPSSMNFGIKEEKKSKKSKK